MKSPNRDLLVLLKDDSMSEHAIEQEVERLNAMLFHVESFENIAQSLELIDLNKFRIFHQKKRIVQSLRDKELKPFVFLFNMN